MDKEKKFLLAVLNAYLNGEEMDIDDGINFNLLFGLAKYHNLAAVVFSVIKRSRNAHIIPKDIYAEFENCFYDAIVRYDKQSEVISQLDNVLTEGEIKHIFFKGAELRDYYPISEVRTMGDIDLLISPDDRDTVRRLLTSNGFELINSNGPVYDYRKSNMIIEVHTKIISGKVGSSDAENGFLDAFNHGIFNNACGKLDPEYHFAYLLTHIAHHFWFYGAGVKLILDLAVMLKTFEIDLDSVLEKMDSMGLRQFSEIILGICFNWFEFGKAANADTTSTEEFLLSYGAFGNMNRNKAAVIQRKELEEGKQNGFMTKLRLLFPPYRKIKDMPYMRFMEGRPYLLPIGWLYRIYYNLKNRYDFVMNTTAKLGSDETNTQAQQELNYFEEIGLL